MDNNLSMLLLAKEPFVGYMPNDVLELLNNEMADGLLVQLFAHVTNHQNRLFCELDEDDRWRTYAYEAWHEVADKAMDIIFDRLIQDGTITSIPPTSKYHVLQPYMQKHGFLLVSGWWVSSEGKTSPAI